MVKLTKLKRESYSEIYQSLPIKFGHVNKVTDDVYEEVYVPFVCRDFFTDVLWATENKKPVSIYNFRFNPEKNSIDEDKTRFAVWFPNEKVKDVFFNNKKELDFIELTNSITPTKFLQVDNLTFIVEADPYWQSRAYLLSLFSGLIRWLSLDLKHDKGHFIDNVAASTTTDGSHFKQYEVKNYIKNLVKDMRKMDVFNYGRVGSTTEEIYDIHNNSGIMGVFYHPESNKYGPHLVTLYK